MEAWNKKEQMEPGKDGGGGGVVKVDTTRRVISRNTMAISKLLSLRVG